MRDEDFMSKANKGALIMALNAVYITVANESKFVITNPRTDLDDAPTIAMNDFKGKKGKKGKLLKDWN